MPTNLSDFLSGSFVGESGFSGYSGINGVIGSDGASGFSGFSGISGFSGSGLSGFSGFSGAPGAGSGSANVINSTFTTTTTLLYPVMVGAANTNSTANVASNLSYNAATSTLSVRSNLNFVSPNGAHTITINKLDSDTLSFSGNSGQLFSITDTLANGSIFSVNDISGLPVIDVDANGWIALAQYGGNVRIYNAATTTSNTTGALIVDGGVGVKGNVFLDRVLFSDGTSMNTAASGSGSGESGFSGASGFSGESGYSGRSGFSGSGQSGFSGISGFSGLSGYSGDNPGSSGFSGFSGFSGSGGGISPWTVKTTNYTAVSGDRIVADSTGGSFTITLPLSPTLGDNIQISDGNNWGTNPVTVARNGSTIQDISDDLSLDVQGSVVELIYDGTTWKVYAGVGTGTSNLVTLNDNQTLTNKTLTDPTIIGTIVEDVYTITDGVGFEIDPSNGSIQLITLGASRTPKATNFAAGESVTLMVDDGSDYAITWTDSTFGGSGVVWKTDGGTAPTLETTGYTAIVLWKIGTQIYGARVGDA